MLFIKILVPFISVVTFSSSIRFDYYKTFNPNLINRRSSTEGQGHHQDDSSAMYYLTGFKSNDEGAKKESYKDTQQKGKHDNEKYKKSHGEQGGHKHEDHDEKHDEDADHARAKSNKGGKYSEKKGHKKGHKTKGWHNMFFRDEYHKEHRFYDDAHKSGDFSKHGDAQSSYHKGDKGHKKGGNHKSNYNDGEHGKKGHSESGRNLQEHKGFNHKQGDEKHHSKGNKYGKQTAGNKGTHYGYKRKPKH